MLNFFRRSSTRATIGRLYGAIVTQARRPVFYTDFAVPDTVDGRFEMVSLHTFLLCHRLKDGDEVARSLAQDVFDAFLDDMDTALREMGVGDLSVPKKMKKMGEAFYGRTGVYDAALGEAEDKALAEALSRNVLGRGDGPAGREARALASYARAAVAALQATAFDEFARGRISFPDPDGFADTVRDAGPGSS